MPVPLPSSIEDEASAVVQRQLDAYNARDVEAILATYAEDAEQYEYPTTLLARGASQLRERFTARFQDPLLHARLVHRATVGTTVVDHEEVTRTFPGGPGVMPLVALYEVRGGRIAVARFLFGQPGPLTGTPR
jgi:hypothetical protein